MAKKEKLQAIQVYTDGAADNNAGIGGYGAVIFMNINGENRMRKFSSTYSYVDTTSNRMELRAVLAALTRIKRGPYLIDIYTDSTYCELMVSKLFKHYIGRNYKNMDLLILIKEQIDRHYSYGSRVRVSWIRGHAGNPFNEMADKLAAEGGRREKKKVCSQEKTLANE